MKDEEFNIVFDKDLKIKIKDQGCTLQPLLMFFFCFFFNMKSLLFVCVKIEFKRKYRDRKEIPF